MKKKFLIVLIIVVVGALILAGLLWYGVWLKESPKVENQTITGDLSEHDPPKQEFPVIVISIKSQNDSGQLGTARLEGMADNKTKVILELTGGSFNQQPAHIHIGSCPNPGTVKYPLTDLESGRSETIVNTDLESMVKSGALAINVHKSEQEISVYTACGDLPRPL